MQKFGHLPKEPIPLEMLVQAIVRDLFLVFAGNGQKNVGFALVVQNLTTNEITMSGNLRPAGMKTLLENALVHVPEDEHEPPAPTKPN